MEIMKALSAEVTAIKNWVHSIIERLERIESHLGIGEPEAKPQGGTPGEPVSGGAPIETSTGTENASADGGPAPNDFGHVDVDPGSVDPGTATVTPITPSIDYSKFDSLAALTIRLGRGLTDDEIDAWTKVHPEASTMPAHTIPAQNEGSVGGETGTTFESDMRSSKAKRNTLAEGTTTFTVKAPPPEIKSVTVGYYVTVGSQAESVKLEAVNAGGTVVASQGPTFGQLCEVSFTPDGRDFTVRVTVDKAGPAVIEMKQAA